jgi:hypothetical protein
MSILSWCNVSAQGYYNANKDAKKYYLSFSYGMGKSWWASHMDNAYLYNIDGSVLRSGNLKITANNPNFNYNASVCFPLGRCRLGAGVCFEKYSMDKLKITSLSDTAAALNAPNSYVLFTENFWFNKIYAMFQRPFDFTVGKPVGLDFVFCAGFYGMDGLHHLNFFGDDNLAKTFFGNVSCILDYEFIENFRIFVQPMFEYKYFHNSGSEYPSIIVHNIFTGCLNVGIRADIGKLKF